jgi:hypothetical protein
MRIPKIFRRKEKPTVTREEAMRAVPLRNPAVTWTVNEEGEVQLTVPLRKDGWMRVAKFVFKIPDTREIQLDEVGSEVWQWCDGENSVARIIERLQKQHKLNRKEAEVSLTAYLKTLAQRGLIGLKLEVDEARRQAIAKS